MCADNITVNARLRYIDEAFTPMSNRERSQQLHERACRVIPGGVDSPVRAFKSVGGEPPYIVRGKGPRIWDADGNEYIDYVGSWGPLILGHAFPVWWRQSKKPIAMVQVLARVLLLKPSLLKPYRSVSIHG